MKTRSLLLGIILLPALNSLSQDSLQSAFSTINVGQTSRPDVSGNVRSWIYGGGPGEDISALFAEAGLKVRYQPGKGIFCSDIRFREGLQFGGRITEIEIKELYAGFKGKSVSILMGNQVVCWGRADGFNPTDNIHPNDYFFLSPDPDDQKSGSLMIRIRAKPWPSAEFELIGIPFYKSSEYRYDLFEMGQGVTFKPLLLPAHDLTHGTLAIKLNTDFPGFGCSLSAFDGYDPFYGFDLDSIALAPFPDIRYLPKACRKTAWGTDLAIPVKQWIFRFEAAYNVTHDFSNHIYIPHPDVSYVLGLEREVFRTICILQYIGKYVLSYQVMPEPKLSDPGNPTTVYQYGIAMIWYESAQFNRKIFHQEKRMNHAFSLSLTRLFAHESLESGITGYYNITSRELLIRPSLKWKVSDDFSAEIGGNWMSGPKGSVFHKAGNVLNGGYAGIKIHF